MPYRLGLDIGTNSIGWCLLKLDRTNSPDGILDLGVRIFHDSRDPQSGTSLASERRLARSARRNRDRYLRRRKRLMDALIRHGLMPFDPAERKKLENLDPYELRARGLDEPLSPYEFGRALFHLGQRRGFRSNRKTDKDEKESSGFEQKMDELRRRIAESGASTLGEYLWRRHRKGKSVRARPGVGFYPARAMYEEEFDKLWQAQAAHHPELDEAAREEIRDAIFFQRALLPVEPGRCELEPEDERAPLALPLTQRFRIYQELANLRLRAPGQKERRLTREERDKLFAKLERQKTVSFNSMRSLLGLGDEVEFNLEDEKRKKLLGDDTSATLARKDLFGARWWNLDEAERDAIVETLIDATDANEIVHKAINEWGLDAEAAERLLRIRLKDGHGRLGRRAMAKIVPIMRDQGLGYAEATEEAGYHHSNRRSGELLETLPYYGAVLSRYTVPVKGSACAEEKEHGRIANPTVHVALNETRKLVNALIAEHGAPDQVVIELARDLKIGQKRKSEIRAEQAENQRRNERIAKEIEDQLGPAYVTGENIRRYKLWEELGDIHDRRCVYTGEIISFRRLFSDEVEIEHILPFSKTLDDSMANRTLALRRANRDKGNRTPYEAFGHNPPGYNYAEIVERARNLPKNKRWRFQPDAMDRFERAGGFIARQLIDTAYIARVAREYLTHVCPANQVYAIPGRLTALLRGKWGLNSLLSDANLKTRVDHRHHAIDAVVAACTDRGLLQRVATAAEDARERLIDDMPEPWEGFRDELRDRLERIVVSHKPDHGTQGRLHEETAYGLVRHPEKEDGYNLVYRKPLLDLNRNEIKRIRDKALRTRLSDYLYEAEGAGRKLKDALAAFSKETGVRRVRLLKKQANAIPITGPDGTAYKAYSPGDNHHVDIFELPNGTWVGKAVTVFEANQICRQTDRSPEYPEAQLVMRVHKGDLLKMEHNGEEVVMKIVKLEPTNNRLWLCSHLDGGDLQKRHDNKDDPFRWALVSYNKLKERHARKVHVDVLGRVNDPGAPT